MPAFASIPELLEEIRAGRMVVVVDDEDRENEGDLIMAASMVRPQDINFMARHARGLICLSLTRERCAQLRLPPMVSDNTSPYRTNFTVSIEAAEGVTTGISAYDRAHTIRTAVRPDAKPSDLSQPGHVFPLQAQPGGVLTRAGHTEAASDLALLAGLEPAGVLVEVLNEDGSMARRPQLEGFAREHGLKIGTIADLIQYRLQTEPTIERVDERAVDTDHGPFHLVTFRDRITHELHFALVRGALALRANPRAVQAPGPRVGIAQADDARAADHASPRDARKGQARTSEAPVGEARTSDASSYAMHAGDDTPTLVRVHVKNQLSDVLHLERADLGLSLSAAMAEIAREGAGVLVVLSQPVEAGAVLSRLREEPLPQPGVAEWRRNGAGAQILADLGCTRLRVLGTPRRQVALAGFGLEVVEYVGPAGEAREAVDAARGGHDAVPVDRAANERPLAAPGKLGA